MDRRCGFHGTIDSNCGLLVYDSVQSRRPVEPTVFASSEYTKHISLNSVPQFSRFSEDGSRMFIRKADTYLQDYTVF
jgi:hypothetical protein